MCAANMHKSSTPSAFTPVTDLTDYPAGNYSDAAIRPLCYTTFMKVLVVEDDARLAELTRLGLKAQGFQVEICGDGNTAFNWILTRSYDAVVLDLILPELDGLSVLQQLRNRGQMVPVVLLTARVSPDDRVRGLNLGADDYLTKPFLLKELAARLRAVGRRAMGGVSSILQVGDLTLNRLTREVYRADRRIELTAREFSLLELFLSNPGHPFTRAQLLEKVWKGELDPETNVVDVTLGRVRRKIHAPGNGKRSLIETIRGVGFRLRPDEGEQEGAS